MAKYYIDHKCGHTSVNQLIGPTKDRERRIEWLKTSVCSDCYQAELAKKREEATKQAQDDAVANELPELTGSEKQVAWAVRIRKEKLDAIYPAVEKSTGEEAVKAEFIDWLHGQTSASWWIDNRGGSYFSLGEMFMKQRKSPEDKADEADVKAESTLRPENPDYLTPIDISVSENTVIVSTTVKNDKLREIVKAHGYAWENGWKKQYNIVKTNIEDRAAEIASKLLASGFVVTILNQNIREKVSKGDYDPEHTRWITTLVKGDNAGWFYISWAKNEDFYNAARKISGSKYHKPGIIIPPQNFDEVVDFAEMYDFRMSPGAKEIAETQERIIKSAHVVSATIKKAGKVKAIDTPPVLEPVEAVIPDEFKD